MILPPDEKVLDQLLSAQCGDFAHLGMGLISIMKYLSHFVQKVSEMVEFPESHDWMPIELGSVLSVRPKHVNSAMFLLLEIQQCHVVLQHAAMEI